LEFQIKLEGNTYNAGEAKGTVLIKADKSLKVRNPKFSVHGKERYEESHGSGHTIGLKGLIHSSLPTLLHFLNR
jgi:hypothetical protein